MVMSVEKRERLASQRRREILDASLQLFDKNGFNSTTIQDIADVAGISKGLIYRHFESKEDILNAHAELIDECEAEIADMHSATEALRLYAYRLLGDSSITGYRPPLRVYVMCYLQGSLSDVMQQRFVSCKHGREYFGEIMKRGQEAGEIREGDPDLLAEIYWHCLIGYTSTVVTEKDSKHELPDLDKILSIFLK